MPFIGFMPWLVVFAVWCVHGLLPVILVWLENGILDPFTFAVGNSQCFNVVVAGWLTAYLDHLEPSFVLGDLGAGIVDIDIPLDAIGTHRAEFFPIDVGCGGKRRHAKCHYGGHKQFLHASSPDALLSVGLPVGKKAVSAILPEMRAVLFDCRLGRYTD